MQVIEIVGEAGPPENITPGNTATGITDSIRVTLKTNEALPGMTAKGALLTCEGATVHILFDGTLPTAASGTDLGHQLFVGDSYLIRGQNNVKNFLCIDAVSGSAGTVKVTPFF